MKSIKLHLERMHLEPAYSVVASLKLIETGSFIISNPNIAKIYDIEELGFNDGETSL